MFAPRWKSRQLHRESSLIPACNPLTFHFLPSILGFCGQDQISYPLADFTEKNNYPRVLVITDYEPAGWVDVKGGDHAGRNET